MTETRTKARKQISREGDDVLECREWALLHSYTLSGLENTSRAEMPNYSNRVSFLLCTEKEEQRNVPEHSAC